MSAAKERFTERQAQAWPEVITDIRSRGVSVDEDIHCGLWAVYWAEETRPGRGHSVNAVWNDGEHFVQILMDVYGYPTASIAALDWLHIDSDEECPCDRCVAERAEDEEPADARELVDVAVVGGVL